MDHTTAIGRLVQAYQEQLVTLDELRARMPELRKSEATIRAQLAALDAQLLDTETYLKLAENLDTFLARLRDSINDASVEDANACCAPSSARSSLHPTAS